jgi:hypothetical protein
MAHDNATPHMAWQTQLWFQEYRREVLQHPAHSPNLAPTDIRLFGFLKEHLSGQRFVKDDDDTVAVMM